jgi:hypothetical protein
MTTLLGEPLPVEFLLDGCWRPALLLGWRHEPDGTCRVRVQAVVGGLRRASWMQLADLRLPQPDRPTVAPPEPRTRPDLLLPGRERSGPAPTPLPPLPVLRRLRPDASWV